MDKQMISWGTDTDPMEDTYDPQALRSCESNLSTVAMASANLHPLQQLFMYLKDLKKKIDELQILIYHEKQLPVQQQSDDPRSSSISLHPDDSVITNTLAEVKIMINKLETMLSLLKEDGRVASGGRNAHKGNTGDGSAASGGSNVHQDNKDTGSVASGRCNICDENREFTYKDIYQTISAVPDISWKHLMRLLRVSTNQMEMIQKQNPTDVLEQKFVMMKLWLSKERQAGASSFKSELHEALLTLKLNDIASLLIAGYRNSAPPRLC